MNRRVSKQLAVVATTGLLAGSVGTAFAGTPNLEIDRFGNTVVVEVDNYQWQDAADLLQGLVDQLPGDPDKTGGGEIAAGGTDEPPCQRAENSGDKIPQSAAAAKALQDEFAAGFKDSSGGFVDDAAGRRRFVEDGRALASIKTGSAGFYFDGAREALERKDYNGWISARTFGKSMVDDANRIRATVFGMVGISGEDFLDGTRTADSAAELWHDVYGGYKNNKDHGPYGDVAGFLDAMAGELDGIAAAALARAREHDAQAKAYDETIGVDANSQAAVDKKAAAERAKAKAEREKATAAKKKADELREKAEEERKKKAKTEPKPKPAVKFVDPDSDAPSLSDLGWLTDQAPWLANTPWNPARRLILVLNWGQDGMDPTNSRPGVEEPSGPIAAPPLGAPGSLILVLDPGVSSRGFPCMLVDKILASDPSIVPPELARPNEYDEPMAPPGGGGGGGNPLPVTDG